MRLRLRTIFDKAKSSTTLRHGAFITIAALFALSAQSSTINNDSFDEILSALPRQAIAYKPNIAKQIQNPHYRIDFQTALTKFQNNCGGLPDQIDTKPEAERWVYNNLSSVKFSDTSLNFRDSIYNLAVTFDASEPKDVLLTSLNQSLPNSQLLMEYMDRKRIELAKILQRDPEIQYAAQHWNTINDDAYKQRILQRVSRITLQTLLPNKDIDYPRVFWDKRVPKDDGKGGGLHNNTYAIYGNNDELISLNGKIDPMNYNFQFASDITIHETIHHFQSILVKWGMDGYFKSTPDLDRHVSILNTISENNAGAVRKDIHRPETFVRYRLQKNESMSWGFSLIGSSIMNPRLTHQLANTLEHNMYTFFEIQEPLNNKYHSNMLYGAPIPKMPQDVHAGKLPRACMVN